MVHSRDCTANRPPESTESGKSVSCRGRLNACAGVGVWGCGSVLCRNPCRNLCRLAESCGKGGQALGRRASASRRHDKLCLRCVAGARDCASPAVAVADARGAPQRSTNPATTGCPAASADCRRSQPCESRGEWRGHSSGRRVVAASVPTASAQAPSALAAACQPGYDGLPGGAQGLRALPPYR